MRVFITGATGFIGSHVARRLLADGCEVAALVRPGAALRRITDVSGELLLLEGELSAPAALQAPLQEFSPELCLHLAWYAVPGQYLQAPENLDCVRGTLEMLRVLDAVDCPRTVIAGTCFEYDHSFGYLSETTPARPTSLYAACKYGLSVMAEQFQRSRGRSLAWPRVFYQYGPGEDPRRLVPLVIGKLLAGEALPFSSGRQIRDFLHVEDVASAFLTAALSDVEGPVNLGSSFPVSVADVAREIGRLLGREELIRFGERPEPAGDPPFIVADTSLLRRNTGWTPRWSLRDGLHDTIRWWQAQPQP